jgi:hypothetical protein
MGIWFIDRPGINNHFGAGIYGPRNNCRESSNMGSHSTVFSAEMMAILRGVAQNYLLAKSITMRIVWICCDSRAAVVALEKLLLSQL